MPGWRLETDPNTGVPVAATLSLVFVPAIAGLVLVLPLPVVRVNGKFERGLVGVALLDVPAIALIVANDVSGCTGHRESERADTQKNPKRGGCQNFHWNLRCQLFR